VQLPDGLVHKEFQKGWASWDTQTRAHVAHMNFTGSQYVNPTIKQRLERKVDGAIGGQMPQDFSELTETYVSLAAKNPGLADAYFGKNGDRMADFVGLLDMSKPAGSRGELSAFHAAFATQRRHPKALDKDEQATVTSAIAEPFGFKVLGPSRAPLREGQAEISLDILKHRVESFRSLPNVSLTEAKDRAVQQAAVEDGTDFVGGYVIKGMPGLRPLSSVLRTKRKGIGTSEGKGDAPDAPEIWDEAMHGKLLDMARERGVRVNTSMVPGRDDYLPDGVVIQRAPDVNGVAWMTVIFKKDGQFIPARLSSDAIENYRLSKTGRKVSGAVTNE